MQRNASPQSPRSWIPAPAPRHSPEGTCLALLLTGLLLAGLVLGALPSHAANPAAARGSDGAVSSAAPAATRAGLATLQAGGNAADAAVTVALALAVVHPQAGNLGGGGFAVVRFPHLERTGEGVDAIAALDFREIAPAAARSGMYLDGKGRPIPGSSLIGPLAAGVPGTPAGLWELHHRYGRLPWSRVVEPAVRLAEDGFVVTPRLATAIEEARDLLERFPETAAVWLPGGKVPVAGSTMVLPQLAATLRAYASDGPAAITSGPAAASIEAVSHRYGGVLSAADLAAYRTIWRDPVIFDAFGWKVASMPLPSSGGIIIGETCGMLERLGWDDLPRLGADRAHLLAEVWRRAYADRFLLGDPQTTKADRSDLLDPRWLDRRARAISLSTASSSREIRPWPAQSPAEKEETTHLSVLDRYGNAVSLTTTLNGGFGCGLLVPGLGFLLNNEMDDFATAVGRPNQFGLIQGEANVVGPGRRMLSSMSPTIAWSEDETLVLGSPGGSQIPTATAQVLLALIVDRAELQAAVDQPRVHHQWLPDQIEAEPDALSPETEGELRRRRHHVTARASIGCVNAVRRSGTVFEAASDPRGPGAADVVTPAPGTRP